MNEKLELIRLIMDQHRRNGWNEVGLDLRIKKLEAMSTYQLMRELEPGTYHALTPEKRAELGIVEDLVRQNVKEWND